MQVLMINGSPHRDGCTATALGEVAAALRQQGIETQTLHIGTKPVQDCTACHGCSETGRCVFDDGANRAAELLRESDGLVVGSPVYYAGPSGALCSLLDRMFFSASHTFACKPAAAVVSCRRGGAGSAFDRLNKYFTISSMPVVSSQYWNAVHGQTPDEVRRDLEGMQIMRTLGDNMAWMIRNLKDSPRPAPQEPRAWTNFIR